MGQEEHVGPTATDEVTGDEVGSSSDEHETAPAVVGREKSPAEVALLVIAALASGGLAGAGLFVWFTRLHPPFGAVPWLMGLGTLVALAGIGMWAEANRAGARTPRWVLAATLAGAAVAVPLALGSALDGDGAPSAIGTTIAGLLLVALLPIVTGLAVDPTRPRVTPWLPAFAVVGGAVLGAGLGVTVALLEAPEFPDAHMQGPAPAAWEGLHAAGTVEFQSLRRTEGPDQEPSRASARGVLDLDTHRALMTRDVGTADVDTQEVNWDPDEPWTAAGPVERLWRALVGTDEWEEASGGWQGVVDQRRITAARIAGMDDLRSRTGARWHMGETTDGSVMTVLVQVDDDGFPTRLVTRERAAGSSVEATTTTTFRR